MSAQSQDQSQSQIDPKRLKAAVDLIGDTPPNSNFEIVPFDDDRFKAVRFFKEYAKNPNRKYSQVAGKLGISRRSAENYIERYIYLHTVLKDKNRMVNGRNEAVEAILKYYNEDLIKSGVHKSELLNAGEIARLTDVVRMYSGMYKILDDDGDPMSMDSELNTNSNDYRRKMSYDRDSRDRDDDYDDEEIDHDGSPEGILESLLRNNKDSVNIKKIPFIINQFKLNPQSFITNPDALKMLLYQAMRTGNKAGVDSIAYLFHHAMQNSGNPAMYAGSYGQNPYGAGGSLGSYAQPGMYGGGGGGGYTDYYVNAAEARRLAMKEKEEESFNEQLNKMMKLTLMRSLQSSANGGGGGDNDFMKFLMLSGGMKAQMTYNKETGLNEMSFVPNAQGSTPQNSFMDNVISKLLENALLNKNQDPVANTLMTKMLDNVMLKPPTLSERIQELSMLKEFVNPVQGQPTDKQLETELKREELQIKRDLLMKDLDIKTQKEEHERTMHSHEQERANQTIDRIMEGINGFADKGLPFLTRMFNIGLQNQQQQQPVQEAMGGYDTQSFDAINPYAGNTVENEALYRSVDDRLNRFTSDISRTSNETIQELKREVNALKSENTAPVQRQYTPPMPEEGTYPYNENESYEVNEPITTREQQPQEFTENDISGASTEELLEAERQWIQQKSQFDDFGSRIRQELDRRSKTPSVEDMDIGDIDPDNVGESNEVLLQEMKIAEHEKERKAGKLKSLWDQKDEDEPLPKPKQKQQDEYSGLVVPDIEELSKEVIINDKKPVEKQHSHQPDDSGLEANEYLEEDDDLEVIKNIQLDEGVEKKLNKMISETKVEVKQQEPSPTLPIKEEKKEKKKSSKKKPKDQALSQSDQ